MDINIVYNESCLETMKRLPDNSIDLVVTSPPYDNLRTYNNESDWNFSIFKEIAKELSRVIKEGGVIVWIVGDATIDGSETGSSFKQALYFKKLGLRIHDTMLYEKNSSPYPAGKNSNRYTQIFEYMFVFSKGKPKTHNLIKDKLNRWGNTESFGSTSIRTTDGELKKHKPITVNEFGVRNNIWRYTTGKSQSTDDDVAFKHPAIFPEKLAKDHIETWSNKGDIVYDPFGGSGTVSKMALILERKHIASEICKDYYDIIMERIQPYTMLRRLW